MTAFDPPELARRLREGLVRLRTGVALLSPSWLGREEEVAARCGLESPLDLPTWVLERVPPGRTRLGLDWQVLVRDHLDVIAGASQPPGRCLLLANVDVLVAALRDEERRRLWGFLRETYRPQRGLMLCLPEPAAHLFPPDERAAWTAGERLTIVGRTGDGDDAYR